MRLIADLHIHSKYSRATSSSIDLPTLAFYGKTKGLSLVGTGDITHPKWFQEVSSQLIPEDDSGFYVLRDKPESIRFMMTTELATVFEEGGKAHRVHHLVLIPCLDIAAQVSDVLRRRGDLAADGRPVFNISPSELVELLIEISDMIEIIPAHAWTPWWSIFGSIGGYDSVEECYKDQANHIHSVETGLSSDPPMNWRLSKLDRYTLVSNSDSHSPQPYRLGREANVFDLKEPSYRELIDVIRRKDPTRLLFTIETKPEYGKYHWTGHRVCGVSMPPSEAIKNNNRCPKCGRRLTIGVEQRVEELADRPKGFRPKDTPSFVYLLPLQELISVAFGGLSLASRKVEHTYALLIKSFGNEFNVLLDAPIEGIEAVVGKEVSRLIQALREDTLQVVPGYDGVYGRLLLPQEETKAERKEKKWLDEWLER